MGVDSGGSDYTPAREVTMNQIMIDRSIGDDQVPYWKVRYIEPDDEDFAESVAKDIKSVHPDAIVTVRHNSRFW